MHGSRRRMAESEFITHNKRKKKEDLCSKSRSKKATVYPNLFLFSQYSCELNNWNLYLINRLAPGEVVNICYLVTRQWSAWKTLLLGHIGWHKYPLLRTLHGNGGILQHDILPCHTAKLISNVFRSTTKSPRCWCGLQIPLDPDLIKEAFAHVCNQ